MAGSRQKPKGDIEELDFDSLILPESETDGLPPGCWQDRSYRWQDDPKRYEPDQPKPTKRKRK